MATGIVSVAMRSDGHDGLSLALLVITAAAWMSLGVLFVDRLCRDRVRWRHEAARPSSLTAVAATAVLGADLTLHGWSWAGWALLAIATALCLVLLGNLARVRTRLSTGAGFLVVVGPQSLAVLAASLADRSGSRWLTVGALLLFAFGIGAYAFVLTRFEFSQLRTGAGDHWVSGGALAISALACAEIGFATTVSHTLAAIHEALRIASLVLWGLTMAWLPVLIGAEVGRRRPSYDVRRWATVFPLGMYSVMSFSVGAIAGVAWIVDFARAWAWLALAAWVATTIGAARAVRAGVRSAPSCSPRSPVRTRGAPPVPDPSPASATQRSELGGRGS